MIARFKNQLSLEGLSSLDGVLEFLRKNQERVWPVLAHSGKAAFVLFLSYLAASTLNVLSILFLAEAARDKPKADAGVSAKRPKLSSEINYTDLRKSVLERNIFSSTGELPEEAEPGEGGQAAGQFNENDVCHKSNMALALVGTIYLGPSGESLATIRESGYNEADVYRKGDKIIGNAQAVVHAIEHQKVILNNNGVKECLEVAPVKGIVINAPSGPAATGASPGGGSGTSHFVLENAYVEDALGPGFAKILDSGRLVPEIKDGQQVGFKLVGVKNDSLWRRIGLNNGDVITAVNGISMSQPDQGFAPYNALQDAREIRFEYRKGGTDPMTITVEIK